MNKKNGEGQQPTYPEYKLDGNERTATACVAAMITNSTPEAFNTYVEKKELTHLLEWAFYQYMAAFGYAMGVGFRGTGLAINKEIGLHVRAIQPLNGMPLLLRTEGKVEGMVHKIYFDGFNVWDPAPRIKSQRKTIRDYSIYTLHPIIRQTGVRGKRPEEKNAIGPRPA